MERGIGRAAVYDGSCFTKLGLLSGLKSTDLAFLTLRCLGLMRGPFFIGIKTRSVDVRFT